MIRALSAAALAAALPVAAGPPGAASASSGVFTASQAERGAAIYREKCAMCHGEALGGGDTNPPLSGGRFLANWTGQSVGDLALRIRLTMPLNQPGSLGLAETAATVAFLLQTNGYPTGNAELPVNMARLKVVKLDAPPISSK